MPCSDAPYFRFSRTISGLGTRCAVQLLIVLKAALQCCWCTTTAVSLAFALGYTMERVLRVGDKFDVIRAVLAVRWCSFKNFLRDQAICHPSACLSRYQTR